MLSTTKPTARLENWHINEIGGASRAYGIVSGHQRVPDGMWVRTSRILESKAILDYKEGDTFETRNTIYVLGKKS